MAISLKQIVKIILWIGSKFDLRKGKKLELLSAKYYQEHNKCLQHSSLTLAHHYLRT